MSVNLASTLPAGSSDYVLDDPRPGPRRAITVFAHRPGAWTPEAPVLIVMHGNARNGRAYRDGWIAESEARGFLLAVPQFARDGYPEARHYNYGDMREADGAPRPRELWMYALVDRVFDDLRARAGGVRERYFLYGHSAGGQVVHRLVTFACPSRVERAVAANPGSYTMPLFDEAFPFGLGGTAFGEDERRALFTRPLTILLGDADDDPNHYELPREPGAMRQGPHRLARGLHYLSTAMREAATLGVPLAWKLRIAPGVGHSNPDIAPYAARALFD